MLNDLSREERLQLMRFVCSFAWADLEVVPAERAMIAQLTEKLELDDEDKELVVTWLAYPPDPEDVDPTRVPVEHKKLFLATIMEIVAADGVLDPDEMESFDLFKQLMVDD